MSTEGDFSGGGSSRGGGAGGDCRSIHHGRQGHEHGVLNCDRSLSSSALLEAQVRVRVRYNFVSASVRVRIRVRVRVRLS